MNVKSYRNILLLALTILATPHVACAQSRILTLHDYTPPPMFGSAASPIKNTEKPQAEDTTPLPKHAKLSQTPASRPARNTAPTKENMENAAIIPTAPIARPNVPQEMVSSSAGPSMPSSPKIKIHKSSIIIEDKSFNTGESMARNIDAFGESHIDPSDLIPITTQNPLKPHEAALPKEAVLESKKTEKAIKTPDHDKDQDDITTLLFPDKSMDLTPKHIETLVQRTLQKFILLTEEYGPSARLQIIAYAQTNDDLRSGVSGAKRLSLARALSVQGWLIDNGISSSQIDVKAKGDETDSTSKDRVDLYFITPKN